MIFAMKTVLYVKMLLERYSLITNLHNTTEKRCKMRYKLQLFLKEYCNIRWKNCFILRLYWEDKTL